MHKEDAAKDSGGSSSFEVLDDQQVPSAPARQFLRENPGISLRYNFGDRKFAMDGRPVSEFTDFEINLKPVPPRNAKDIRHIAKVYKRLMEDPEIAAMKQAESKSNMTSAVVCLLLILAVVYFWA